MAKVRCPCGRQYNVSDEFLGKLVKCGKCGKSFEAKALAAPPRATATKPSSRKPAGIRKLRIGDMAVHRGLISRDQLDACLEYQMVLNTSPGEGDQRLGQILVQKGLLKKEQLARLLGQQQRGAAEEVAAGAEAATKAADKQRQADSPVSQAQRDKIRASLEAATRKQAERAAAVEFASEPGRFAWLRLWHFGIAGALAVAAIAIVLLWPAPAPQRTLVAYLESCKVDHVAPDASLAVPGLSLDVRAFGDVRLLDKHTYTYADELKAFEGLDDAGETWADLIATVKMPEPKKMALSLAVQALPASTEPLSTKTLTVTVQEASLWMASKPRGMGMYRDRDVRGFVLKVETPSWSSGWKVAACLDIGAGTTD